MYLVFTIGCFRFLFLIQNYRLLLSILFIYFNHLLLITRTSTIIFLNMPKRKTRSSNNKKDDNDEHEIGLRGKKRTCTKDIGAKNVLFDEKEGEILSGTKKLLIFFNI